MSLDPIVAVVTDALRGLLHEGLPALPAPLSAARVAVGLAAGDDAPLPPELAVQLVALAPVQASARPPRRGEGPRPPQVLDLDYLVAARAADPLDADALLGFALDKLAREPVVNPLRLAALVDPARLARLGPDNPRSLTLLPMPLPVAEATALWRALRQPLRPALSYRVRVSCEA